MIIELPYPPSVNKGYGYAKKHRYVKPCVLDYKTEVFFLVKKYKKKHAFSTFINPVFVITHLFPPTARDDIDNAFKFLFDALTYSDVWTDDILVKQKLDIMHPPLSRAKVIIEITDLATETRFSHLASVPEIIA